MQKRAVNAENRQYISRSRGGKTTKIHALVNGSGQIIDFFLTGGQTYDSKAAVRLLSGVDISGSHILADKAYGAASIRKYITEQGGEYTIPPRRNLREPWEYDRERYKHRNVIECFFNRLKAFRRVATRYDKLASSFCAFVCLASIALLSLTAL